MLAVGGLVLNWNGNSNANRTPSGMVENYYALAFDGKINEALFLWAGCVPNSEGVCADSSLLSGEDTIVRWTKSINQHKDIYKIEDEKVTGSSASVLVITQFPNGYSDKTIYKLIKINGKWMLKELSSPAMEEANSQAEKFNQDIDGQDKKEP